MSDLDILKKLVTPITDANKEYADSLPTDSYSSLDLLDHCTYQYKFKYIDKFRSSKGSLAMECGTCLHKCLEIKGRCIINKEPIDYDYLQEIAREGCLDVTEKGNEQILGFNQLKKKYFDDYYKIDENTGMNYDQKLQLFFAEVLPDRMEDDKWEIVGTEVPFRFIYDNRVVIKGFIDRIDRNKENGELRITDYKSSKKVYDKTKLATPLQHFIYDLACVAIYGQIPTDHVYDFILLNKIQTGADGVCTKRYIQRGLKKLDKLLDLKEELIKNNSWIPHPTPLCYWCAYHSDSPFSDPQYKGVCKYHLLWTPDNKTFAKLNEWNGADVGNDLKKNESVNTKRKLIF